MSAWRHSLCNDCWVILHEDRVPHRFVADAPGVCCMCGVEHTSGIYMRAEPGRFQHCQHPEET